MEDLDQQQAPPDAPTVDGGESVQPAADVNADAGVVANANTTATANVNTGTNAESNANMPGQGPQVTRNGNVTTIRMPMSSSMTRGNGQNVRQFRLGASAANGPIQLDLGNGRVVSLNGHNGALQNRIIQRRRQRQQAPQQRNQNPEQDQESLQSPSQSQPQPQLQPEQNANGTGQTNGDARRQQRAVPLRSMIPISRILGNNGNATQNAANTTNTTGGTTMDGTNADNANRDQTQVNVRVVQIPNLVPQPVMAAPGTTEEHEQDDDGLAKFKCLICSEFMKDPVGCGKCSSRFCNHCLQRVAGGADNRQNRGSATATATAKCPTCRVEFTAADIVRDDELRQQIRDAPVVKCRYHPACDGKFQLHEISQHEKTCPEAPCKCRYASYGCTWQGPRGEVASHETDGCIHSKVSPIIEQVRRMNAEYGSRMEILHQQVSGTMRMQAVQRQNFQRGQSKCMYNLFDFFEYCHIATCCTPYLFKYRDQWVAFHQSRESCASVLNTLMLLPTMLVCLQVSAGSFRDFMSVITKYDLTGELSDSDIIITAENILAAILVFMFGFATLVLAMADSASSMKYMDIPLAKINVKYPIVRDFTAVAVMLIHHRTWLFGTNAWFPSITQWFLVTLASTFFPSLILTVSNAINGIPVSVTQVNINVLGRAVAPILLGLKYAHLGLNFEMASCLDAACLMLATKKVLDKIYGDTVSDDCFLDLIPPTCLYVYMGARLSVFALHAKTVLTSNGEEAFNDMMLDDSLLAYWILILLNVLLKKLVVLGIILGKKMSEKSQSALRSEGFRHDYDMIGMVAFGTWSCLMIGIACI